MATLQEFAVAVIALFNFCYIVLCESPSSYLIQPPWLVAVVKLLQSCQLDKNNANELILGYSESCSYSQSGYARLAGFNSSYVGFIQVCKEGYWTAISFEEEEKWTRKNAGVACKELGFQGAVGVMMKDV